MLLRDLASSAVINLESKVRLSASQGVADGEAWLAPNGQTPALATRVACPDAVDTNPMSDVFALDIASKNARLVTTGAAGRRVGGSATQLFWLSGHRADVWCASLSCKPQQIAFCTDHDTSAGAAGVYVNDLATGALDRVFDRNLTCLVGNHAALSFTDDGRKLAYVESTGGGITSNSNPRGRDIASGTRLNAAA